MIIIALLLILVASFLGILFLKVRYKGILTVLAVFMTASISGLYAIKVLLGGNIEFILSGTYVTGEIPLRIDALSAWFILLINFTILTGALYGLQYMKSYRKQAINISLHCLAFLGIQTSLTAICIVQNAIVFLFLWEIMALSSFILIIFEHYRQEVIKAGINYLIQAHIAIVFLYIGFIWVGVRMHSYDFKAITEFSATFPQLTSLALFLCFFIAFAIKAGFVPFHTWLPYAHPASPAHISGVMSGVIIKIGIYGILRLILLIHTDFVVLGVILLIISAITGIYGVMLAIIQHNLKKLLAYHSIENIGIIGIGIGLGSIGLGTNNYLLTTLGFAGSLLHVLNHSLFKSVLFFAAGNVYQSVHTLNIEHLGGLVKRMPHTSVLFLISALAICGLPPFNGFVSEFIIYTGLYKGMLGENMFPAFVMLSSILGMVLIGGLALLCFTKAFGVVFLGKSRHNSHNIPVEAGAGKLIPMYMTTVLILAIGLFPGFFIQLLSEPLKLFTAKLSSPANTAAFALNISETIKYIGWSSIGFMALSGIIFFLRKKITNLHPERLEPTWGCGYTGETEKMQYTANSFVRSYRKLAKPLLSMHKKELIFDTTFPGKSTYETAPNDKIEEVFIDIPLKNLKFFFGKFSFLQNGKPQFYILYGFVFIALVLAIPYLYDVIKSFIAFLNQL